MKPLLALVVLFASACNDAVDGFTGGCFSGGGGTGGGFAAENVLLAGTEATVELLLTVPGCSSFLDATAVQTTVVGPDNLPVAHTHDAPRSDSFEYRVNVTFTPPKAGPYHLVATFQPNLGVAQLDLRAARDFTQQPTELTLAGTCEQVAVTTKRTVLCWAGSMLDVVRDGASVQSFTAELFTVSGDVVWITRGFEASRSLDTGTGPLQPIAPAQLNVLARPRALLGGPDDLWVVSDGEVRRYLLEAGAFVNRERWTFPYFSSTAVVAQNAEGLLVAASGALCSTQGADAGTLECGLQFQVLGATRAGIWGGQSPQVAELFVPGRLGPVRSLPAAAGTTWQAQARQGELPRADGAPYTLAFEDGAPVLGKWSSPPAQLIEGWAMFHEAGRTLLRRAP